MNQYTLGLTKRFLGNGCYIQGTEMGDINTVDPGEGTGWCLVTNYTGFLHQP